MVAALTEPDHWKSQVKMMDKTLKQFSPVGMRVLVVDDSNTCLMVLERLLELCDYVVTACSCGAQALATLTANAGAFDIVISDIRMPNMDGFELLRLIKSEMDIPVILMSGDGGTDVVIKGITYGACHYMMKPVEYSQVRNIWQHVFLKNLVRSPSKKKKAKRDNLKKCRMWWSPHLHQRFVDAVNQLGVDNAVPKRVLEMMGVPGLTRDQVSSHLQRYRKWVATRIIPRAPRFNSKDIVITTPPDEKSSEVTTGAFQITFPLQGSGGAASFEHFLMPCSPPDTSFVITS